jgi:rhodanese-related sulfurtransferase
VIGRILRESAIIAVLAALPAGVMAWQHLQVKPEGPLAPGEVRLSEAKAWEPAVLWVDARSPAKHAHRTIPGAVQIDPENWEERIPALLDAWDPDKRIVVFGDREGDAAATVALRLREEMQLSPVWMLHGGFEAWLRP